MSWVGCEETTWWLTWALNEPDVQARVRELRAAGASPSECTQALIAALSPEVAAVAAEEMRELPSVTASTLIEAWVMADAAQKPFKVVALRPERPIQSAKAREVTLTIQADSAGVTVGISHVAGHHARWYAAEAN